MESFQPIYQIDDTLALNLMRLAKITSSTNPTNTPTLALDDLLMMYSHWTGKPAHLRNQEQATFLPHTERMHAFAAPNTLKTHLTTWLQWHNHNSNIPAPIKTAIAYFTLMQLRPFATHNQPMAQHISEHILTQSGYPAHLLDNIAAHPGRYLHALTATDLSAFIAWFCTHLVESFSALKTPSLRDLNMRQRKILNLFVTQSCITSLDVGKCLKVKDRARAHICQKWVESGFLVIDNPSNKARTYRLSTPYQPLLQSLLHQSPAPETGLITEPSLDT